jgi:hypothetical protein
MWGFVRQVGKQKKGSIKLAGMQAYRTDSPRPAVLCSAIDFFAVADLDDKDDELLVLNRIDDSVGTFSDSIEVFLTGQFLHALRPRIFTEGLEPFDDAFLNRIG